MAGISSDKGKGSVCRDAGCDMRGDAGKVEGARDSTNTNQQVLKSYLNLP